MQQIFDRKTLWQNQSVSTFKDKLSFSVLKLLNYKTRAFNRKVEKAIPILLHRLPRTITSDIVVRFSRRILCSIPPAML